MRHEKKKVEYTDSRDRTGTFWVDVIPESDTPAINIERAEDDHGHVTISNCTISRDGFSPLTRAVTRMDDTLAAVGFTLCFVIVIVSLIVTL
ncbi:hypothetical protein DRQ25_15610 [Candidatus Fermentibacteria bacterium]|nr:MAG: hypothetical protein DRQ25_15610 [Candidatus Fermentibacteria bacterium]